MEPYKIRVKIGVNEFEAEGPRDAVEAQFQAWKELISIGSNSSTTPTSTRLPSNVTEVRTRDGEFAAPWDIFDVDDKRQLIILKAHPSGEKRDADATLLILYGYLKAQQKDELLVTKIKDSLESSGLRPKRIDRVLSSYVTDGLILKTGRGKGGKYRLTTTGLNRADGLARELFEKMDL